MRKIFTGAAIGPQAALLAAVAMAADVADHQTLVLVTRPLADSAEEYRSTE